MGMHSRLLRTLGPVVSSSLRSTRQHLQPKGVTPTTGLRSMSSSSPSSSVENEYAFEMSCANIRYGEGSTMEVGQDVLNLGAKNVCVMTDKTVAQLPALKMTIEALDKEGIKFKVYDDIRVEPNKKSFEDARDFAIANNFDLYIAVGGGSVMDTCKAANLYACNTDADFLDYVNAPIGKGIPVTHQVKPVIAIPTTAGTGSETTGTAVFDFTELRSKTGISSRAIRPYMGILDPLHMKTMPERVTAYSGIDVLCHALESYTAIPYYTRARPANPNLRPAYQGSNPVSDVWSLHALRITSKYIKRAVYNADDMEARSAMLLASNFAAIGFGNAGCHLCHGMSYPISGQVKNYTSKDYDSDHPLVPHGLSVVITAPSVFDFTASACPERHLAAAEALGVDISNARKEDAGKIISDVLRKIMSDIGCPNGISSLGYTTDDIPALVKGTLPQHRVTKLSPRPANEEDLTQIFLNSMTTY